MPRKKKPKNVHRRLPTAYLRPSADGGFDEMVEYRLGFHASREVVARLGLASNAGGEDVRAE